MSTNKTLSDIYRIFDSIEPDDYGCHQWPTAFVGYYWRVMIRGKAYKVHRLALERKLGRLIRPGYDCLHDCDCKSCVNPEHLREGSDLDNSRDRQERFPETYRHLKEAVWSRSQENRNVLRKAAAMGGKAAWEKDPERMHKQMDRARKARWDKYYREHVDDNEIAGPVRASPQV
jgi:hypothetical protein